MLAERALDLRYSISMRSRRGQALAEYAIAAGLTFFLTYAVMQLALAALKSYYQEITTLLCLPIP